jgi:hypothetical protein
MAIELKKNYSEFIDLQICAFAQDPIFSTENGGQNRSILSAALDEFGAFIDVIGTTPYVEADAQASRRNIQWAVQTAMSYEKHLDFHIEYNLQGGDTTQTFEYLIDTLVANSWPTHQGARTVVLGHATRLSQASHSELLSLAERINSTGLPIHFVGLPTSDLFMMGRAASDNLENDLPLSRPCGTLNVPRLVKKYQLNAALAVNNVGNAFTPYGTGDPLALACWGVGVYHAGTEDDAKLLYEAVSTRAIDAIMPSKDGAKSRFELREGQPWVPMLFVANEESWEIGRESKKTVKVKARHRLAVKDVVWDPPETRLRTIV